MSSSEEYLENLLQSMMNGEAPTSSEREAVKQKSAIELLSGEEPENTIVEPDVNKAMSPEEIEAMFAKMENESDSNAEDMDGNVVNQAEAKVSEASDSEVDEFVMDDISLDNSMDESLNNLLNDPITDFDSENADDLEALLSMTDTGLEENHMDAVSDELTEASLDDTLNALLNDSIEFSGIEDSEINESSIEEIGEIDDLTDLFDMEDMALEESAMDEMPDMSEMSDMMEMTEIDEMSDIGEVSEIGELSDIGDISYSDGEVSMDDLPDLLGIQGNGVDESGNNESGASDSGMDDLSELLGMSDMALEDTGMDEDMAEFNGLLEQSGQEVDDEMMALLKSVSDSSETNYNEAESDALNFFNSEGTTEASGNAEMSEEASDKKKKKEKKKKEQKAKKERRFGKKNKDVQSETELSEEVSENSVTDDLGFMEGLDGLTGLEGLEGIDSIPELGKKPKKAEEKKGFFARFVDFLLEEDEEEEAAGQSQQSDSIDDLLLGEPSNENKELLNELDEEDKTAKKKKDKKDKKGKKAKKAKKNQKGEEATEDEDGVEASEESAKPKKKKKPKKEKKKETEESIDEKPSKKISKKKVIPILLFCATIAACIILLSSIVPTYLQKRDAQVAYDLGNYEEAYNLLYGKELSDEEDVILHKSRIILKMERKLETYKNYQKMNNKELESLDVLLQGVDLYYDLLPYADEYHVTGEISSSYQEILSILSERYGLSETDALEVVASEDNVTYTEYLYFLVYGTIYGAETDGTTGEETSAGLEDILPEEQEIIDGMSSEEATE